MKIKPNNFVIFKGFTTSNGTSLTSALANNLVYDYTNADYTNMNSTNRYIYRVQQTTSLILNTTVPQLTVIIWSGKYFIFACIRKR
jgi:hypothetical protein